MAENNDENLGYNLSKSVINKCLADENTDTDMGYDLPPNAFKVHDYEKENDLSVYVHCVERIGQLAAIMNVYPKDMTLEQVYESVKYQLDKYRKLVIGR